MRTQRIAMAVALAAALLAPMAAQNLEVELQRVTQKETVTGDLKAAIEEYKKIASRAGANRKVGAQALIHMAESYQKMGDSESRKIYEQVVKDYADQREVAALAKVRLGVAASGFRVKGDRPVWTGPMVDMFGRVSPDGRFITFVDWNNGSLMVHDVSTNADRTLTPPASNYSQSAGYSAISRDGKRLVYVWSDENNRVSLRIAAFPGSGLLEPRQVFLANDGVRFIDSFDWSPDLKWIAAGMRLKDGTGQIVLISVTDGSSRVLRSTDWNVPERIFFSLDSKYIAYDRPASDTDRQRDVYVLAIDGSRETPAVINPAQEMALGWSPDGSRLLFSSDRTGSVGLWGLPFADGKAQGAPELLRTDIGSSAFSLGLTASGSLYLYKGISSRDIKIAPVDLTAGKFLEPPSNLMQGFLPGASNPNWSPDGKNLAYAACDGRCLAVRSVGNGQVRKVPHTLLYLRAPHWSSDGGSFLVAGRDSKGRDGIYQVDAQTGAVSPLVQTASLGADPRWSPDGKKIYYVNRRASSIVERDLASGTEREVIRDPRLWREVNLSPDGRYLAVQTGADASKTPACLLLVPVAGGESRELIRLTEPDNWGVMGTTAWTSDSKAILKVKRTGSGTELLLIPTDGAPFRKLGIDSDIWTQEAQGGLDQGFSLSPGGRHIAFLSGKSAVEVWALENFLPAQTARK